MLSGACFSPALGKVLEPLFAGSRGVGTRKCDTGWLPLLLWDAGLSMADLYSSRRKKKEF